MINKQEVIEKIEKEKSNLNAWEDLTRNRALDDALAIIRKLDEPKKPVVPQFVADWYEEHKDDLNTSIYSTITRIFMKANDEDLLTAFESWLMCNENSIVTVVSMHQFGYEVKKEKLYTVEIPNPNDFVHTILHRTEKGIIISYSTDENYKNIKQNQLTEAEIKQDFEWAWQFAKEVDE